MLLLLLFFQGCGPGIEILSNRNQKSDRIVPLAACQNHWQTIKERDVSKIPEHTMDCLLFEGIADNRAGFGCIYIVPG